MIVMNKEIDEILKELENHDILDAIEDIYLLDYIKTLQQENKQLKERIDKAIEYIYHTSTRRKVFADIYDEYKNSEPKFYGNIKDLLEILKGDINE